MSNWDSWSVSSSLQVRSPAKRSVASNSLSRYRAKQLQGERHDGQSIPERPYRYWLQGKLLDYASHKRARQVMRRTRNHLNVLFRQLKGSYKSMTPFPFGARPGSTRDTAVQVELGLVYRVISVTDDTLHSSLLYSLYTPLDFLDFRDRRLDTNSVDGPDPTIQEDLDSFFASDDSKDMTICDFDEFDYPDGKADTVICQHDGNPQLLMCLGVDSELASPFVMAVDHFGEVFCSGIQHHYRPAQFMILNDDTNNTTSKHVVSIRCLGMGPSDNWYLSINKDRTGNWKFAAEEADGSTTFVPKDSRFHFVLTLHEKGLLRFQAVGGDQRYLAFGSAGQQVKVTARDLSAQRADQTQQEQTLFSFSPL